MWYVPLPAGPLAGGPPAIAGSRWKLLGLEPAHTDDGARIGQAKRNAFSLRKNLRTSEEEP